MPLKAYYKQIMDSSDDSSVGSNSGYTKPEKIEVIKSDPKIRKDLKAIIQCISKYGSIPTNPVYEIKL